MATALSAAARRRVEVLRAEQDSLTELIAEVSLLAGYSQGYAHVGRCRICLEISREMAS